MAFVAQAVGGGFAARAAADLDLTGPTLTQGKCVCCEGTRTCNAFKPLPRPANRWPARVVGADDRSRRPFSDFGLLLPSPLLGVPNPGLVVAWDNPLRPLPAGCALLI
jgi:hypothetical protein